MIHDLPRPMRGGSSVVPPAPSLASGRSFGSMLGRTKAGRKYVMFIRPASCAKKTLESPLWKIEFCFLLYCRADRGSRPRRVRMTNVTGFLVRTSLSDNGTLPRTGPWTGCPDIIPAGINSLPRNELISSYGSVTDKDLSLGLRNNLYLRAKNMNSTPLTQTAWMFQVPGNLVLQPQVWFSTNNLIGHEVYDPAGSGTPDSPDIIKKFGQVITAAPGQIAVTEAYNWIPQTSEHHCIVAVVANSWDDVLAHYPSNPIKSVNDLGTWIYSNGSIGWHNVNIQPMTTTVYENWVNYSNTDHVQENITFTMVAQNVPVGTRISFSANSSTSGGQTIGQDWVSVTKPLVGGNINPDFEVGSTILVDANYSTVIRYRTDFNGTTPPANFDMSVTASVPAPKPAPKNRMMASMLAADSFSESYHRSHSATAIFTDPDGRPYGQGLDGYQKMMIAAWGPSHGGGSIGNLAVVLIGSHTTKPYAS
jgi:hypothetical protein